MYRDLAGEELANLAEQLMPAHGNSFSAALAAARAQRPDLARAYNEGSALVAIEPARHAGQAHAGPDAGEVLSEAVADLIRKNPALPYDEAQARVFRDPANRALVRAYNAGDTTPVHQLAGTGRTRHFSDLSQAEQRQHSPWLRRLEPGETRDPNRTYVAKMGDAMSGGGMFEVLAA